MGVNCVVPFPVAWQGERTSCFEFVRLGQDAIAGGILLANWLQFVFIIEPLWLDGIIG